MRKITFTIIFLSVSFLFMGFSQPTTVSKTPGEARLANEVSPILKVDQSNTITSPEGLSLGEGLYGQTYIPNADNLAQVDLLITINNLAAPVETTVGLYADITQAPLATAVAIVEPPQPGQLARTISYRFDPPIAIVRGATYTIGWSGLYPLAWQFSYGDPYPNGQAVLYNGVPLNPTADLVFTTYYAPCSSVTEIPQTECEALVDLYDNTGGDNWINNTNWLVTNTPSNWYGVTVSNGHVIHLFIPDNQLNGNIPPELGNLTALHSIGLYNNQLTGSIPPELGNLTALWSIDLGNNQLTGSIPPELGNLMALQALTLNYNHLTGNIPDSLGNLISLEILLLRSNILTGSIPPELGNLTVLRALDIANNQLAGSIPSSLGDIIGLQGLWLNSNMLTGNIPSTLGNLKDLYWLDLALNQLTGGIPSSLGNLTALYWLDLRYNYLSGSLPYQLGFMSSLRYLGLGANPLSGSVPLSLTVLPLTFFDIHATHLCEPTEPQYLAWKETVQQYYATELSCGVPLTADLSITKNDWPDPVMAGSNIEYTLSVYNAGPDPAESVFVGDGMAEGTTFVSVSTTDWACEYIPGVKGYVVCTLPNLAPNTAAPDIIITVQTPTIDNQIGENTIVNWDILVHSNTNDPDLTNNRDEVQTLVSFPAIDVEKYVSIDGGETWHDADMVTGPYLLSGTAPQFKFVVSNTGNAPLSNVDLTDLYDFGNISLDGTLAVGASIEFFRTGTWAADQHNNTALVEGEYTDERGTTKIVRDDDPATYYGAAPSIDVEKYVSIDGGATWVDADTATGPYLSSGTTPQFKIVVINNGNVTLSNMDLVDDMFDDMLPPIALDGTLCASCTSEYFFAGTWAAGQQTNTATGTGSFTDDNGKTETVTDSDKANYFGADPKIKIGKVTVGSNNAEGDDVFVIVNDTVTWKYTLTNVGNVPLNNATVVDNPEQAITCPAFTTVGDLDGVFDPQESITCTASATNKETVETVYNNTATAIGSYTDEAGHVSTPSATDTSSYTSRAFGMLMTNSELCTLLNDQFRLIFTPDLAKGFKLNATNPGQFYYNMFYYGNGDEDLTLTLPYPWVTQGAVPIHAYSDVAFTTNNGGQTCLSPSSLLSNPPQSYVTLSDYKPQAFGTMYKLVVHVPPTTTGFIYLSIHLDYGLKGTTYWSKGYLNQAISSSKVAPYPYPTVNEGASYTFEDSQGTKTTLISTNAFKQNPGIGGLVQYADDASPVVGATVEISLNGALQATLITDEDGWYMWQYKWTGKRATFKVRLTAGTYNDEHTIVLKSNEFIQSDFLDVLK